MPDGQWEWLVDRLVTPLRALLWREVGPALTSPIHAILQPIWAVRNAAGDIRHQISRLPGLITGALIHPLWGMKDGLARIPGLIVNTLVHPLWGMKDGLARIPGLIVNTLVHPLWGMKDGLARIPGLIANTLVHPLYDMRDRLASLPGLLTGGLLHGFYSLRDIFNEKLEGARLAIRQISIDVTLGVYNLVGSIQHLEDRLLLSLSLFVLDTLAKRGEMQAELLASVRQLGTDFLAAAGPAISRGVPSVLGGITDSLTAILESGLAGVQNIVLGQGQITPERASEVGVRAFMVAAGLGATAHALATAIELLHPLRYVGLHYLSGFIAEMGGYSAISGALMGTMARVAIAFPMQYYIQARTRPVLPTAGDLQAMHRKHSLSPSEFGENMAYQGYSQFWIDRYIEYLPSDPRLFEILRLAETGIPDTEPDAAAIPLLQRLGIRYAGNRDWWLQMKMALAGYNWIDIPKLVQCVRYRMTNTERTRLISSASVNFRNGYMTESDFRAELAAAGKQPEQIDWKIRAERLSALRDDINDLVKLFTDQYLKDILTEGDLRVALVNSGLTPRKADILTARASIRKMPKPTDPTRAEEEKALRTFQTKASQLYKEQYKADLITAEEYGQALRAIGIRDNVAWVTVEIEATKRGAQTRKVAIKESAQATVRVQRARERLYREQFRTGQITSETYYRQLIEAGTLPDEARATTSLEVTRRDAELRELGEAETTAAALRTRSAYERLARARYRTGLIDAVAYQVALEEAAVPIEAARAIVALETTNRLAELEAIEERETEQTARAARRLRETLARERFRSGEIGEDFYLGELLEAGTAPGLARATVALEVWKRYDLARRAELKVEEKEALALQRQQADLLIRRYRAGDIQASTLRENLVAIGIPDILAWTTVELEIQKRIEDSARVLSQLIVPAIRAPWELYVKQLKSDLAAGEITSAQYLEELISSGLAEHVARLIIEVT